MNIYEVFSVIQPEDTTEREVLVGKMKREKAVSAYIKIMAAFHPSLLRRMLKILL